MELPSACPPVPTLLHGPLHMSSAAAASQQMHKRISSLLLLLLLLDMPAGVHC